MNGLFTIVRRDMVSRLKGNAGITALVPAVDIHGQTILSEPNWPFIKTGRPSLTPRRAACLDAGTVLVAVHAFARPRYDGGGAMIETAEDHADRIGKAIEAVLDRAGGEISDGAATGRVRYMLADRQLMPDGAEEDAFHWFANAVARVTAA